MQTQEIEHQVRTIFERYGLSDKLHGDLAVISPLTGEQIAMVSTDSSVAIHAMVKKSVAAQLRWKLDRGLRVEFLQFLKDRTSESAAELSKLVHYDSGKSIRESRADVGSTLALIDNTINAASYAPLSSGATRSKEYTPLGVVLIIEPFNFFSIKLWTGIPALLSGNTIICKASENASLPTILYAEIVRRAVQKFNEGMADDLVPEHIFQAAIGGSEVGKALVADQQIAKVVVTGSIAVCEKVKLADDQLAREAKALTEGGAANFVVVTDQHDGMERAAYLAFVVGSLFKSILPYGGQKCINTRLLAAHVDLLYDLVVEIRAQLATFAQRWTMEMAFSEDNPFEYSPLINRSAGERFQWALRETVMQGGELVGGERLEIDHYPEAHYYRPAFGIFPGHVPLLNEEIFGPYFAVIPYTGGIENALELTQKPNARLVNAFYGSDATETKVFKRKNDAGFTLVNPPLGTGLLPPYGLGFGGNGLSGQGESFARDPESIFVKQGGDIKRFVTFKLPSPVAE